jgi:flagellin
MISLNDPLIPLANHQLASTHRDLSNSLIRLATGRRINQAAQDAVDLVMGSRLQSDIAALEVARQNSQDALSMTDTASGALESAADLLVRAEELTIRAGSSALSDSDRALIDDELQSIKANLNDLASDTTFNGRPVFDNEYTFVTGTNSTDLYSIEVDGLSTAELGIDEASLSSTEEAQEALSTIQFGLDKVLTRHASVQDFRSQLASRSEQIGTNIIHLSRAYSRIADADYAKESVSISTARIKQQAGSMVLVHAQANLSAFLSSFL